MRILRLDFGAEIGSADLHPFISVVHGLDEARCSRLISAIRALVTGSGFGVAGLVERDGELVELSPSGIAQVGPYTTEDVVITIDRLTGGPELLPQLRAELDQRQVASRIASVAVEEVRADLVPSAAARVQRLRDLIDGNVADPDTSAAGELRAAIRRAIAAIDAIPATVREVPSEIGRLISDWEVYQSREAVARTHLEELTRRVQLAEESLADAMRFVTDAEADAKPVLLDPEDEDRLEELAHPTLEGRRFRGRDRSGAHDEEIAALLAKVNQPSYSAYAMYRLSPVPPPEKVAILEAAQAHLASARAEAEAAREALQFDDTARELAGLHDRLKDRAREFFGPMLPADVGEALRTHVVERPNPAWIEAVRNLHDQFLAAEVAVPDHLEPEQLPLWADDWLCRQEAAEQQTGAIDRVQLEAELDRAEATLDRHARAMARIDRLECQAAESRLRLEALERQITRIEVGQVSSAEAAYEGIVDMVARLRASAGVSVPLVIRGNFTGITDDELSGLFDRIEQLAQSAQLVVITDRNAAAAWARAVGLRRALCAGTTS